MPNHIFRPDELDEQGRTPNLILAQTDSAAFAEAVGVPPGVRPPNGPDGSIDQYTTKLLDSITARLQNGYQIAFQFPPKIKSESNSSEWMTEDAWTDQKIKIHKGSDGRKLKMEWDYVATDNKWTAKAIGDTLRNLKSYFFVFSEKWYPVIFIKYTQVIPEETEFRIDSLNITYSDEIIENNGFHPLHSRVSADLSLVTQTNAQDGAIQKIDPLQPARWEFY